MNKTIPIHPGIAIRERFPKELTVKEAAKILKVGRPALSNLLNGNSSLSPDMAYRVQDAFGFDAKELLDQQMKYDDVMFKEEASKRAVLRYVPEFMQIRANDLASWGGTVNARTRLPVLVRKLVSSTAKDLKSFNFPGYDLGEAPGWDGTTEALSESVYVPMGKSGWELGCGTPASKAKRDFATRSKALDPAEKRSMHFIFVTTHLWPGKNEWIANMERLNEWKSVRAYDANDLEHWLEQSITGQIWLGEQIGQPTSGVESLERRWDQWAGVTQPTLTKEIFSDSVNRHAKSIQRWLENAPNEPFVVASASKDEALAFLSALFDHEDLVRYRDRTAVFREAPTLHKIASSSAPFIGILPDKEVQADIGSLFKKNHLILIVPKNANDDKSQIAIEPLSYQSFQKALVSIGLPEDSIDRYYRESGHSAAILRRLLSVVEPIKTPRYISDTKTAQFLIAYTFAGAWHAESEADKRVLCYLANVSYETIEERFNQLASYDENPVWSYQDFRGVVSQKESLFSLRNMISKDDLNRFFEIAHIVLSESDPALELPEGDRWAANIYGKTRNHSGLLRKRICEMLILLGVHGDYLFNHLGYAASNNVNVLIRKLLTPLSLERVLSQNKDLTFYAEAAPEEFLAIVESDLKQEVSVLMQLMKPASNNIFVGTDRTDLLFALEILAWNPDWLLRVSVILSKLSQREIDDNYMNKPINSLKSIFMAWFPQTSATKEDRLKVLDYLMRKFANVGWKVCIDQFDTHQAGHSSSRPRWRTHAAGYGNLVTRNEHSWFVREVFKRLIDFNHSVESITELMKIIFNVGEEYQDQIINAIEDWISKNSYEEDRSAVREVFRHHVSSSRRIKQAATEKIQKRISEVNKKLISSNPVARHQWLFKNSWVTGVIEGIGEYTPKYEERDNKIYELRTNALKDILQEGFGGLRKLIKDSGAVLNIGWILASEDFPELHPVSFLNECLLESGELSPKFDELIAGYLQRLKKRERLLVTIDELLQGKDQPTVSRILKNAPFTKAVWDLAEALGVETATTYWKTVIPSHYVQKSEFNEFIDKLIEVQRPHAAFQAIHFRLEQVETRRLVRLLQDIAKTSMNEPFPLQFNSWDISNALKNLQNRAEVSEVEMADLEFLYIRALEHSEHGIPNLEKQLAKSPLLFVQAIAITFKRTDTGADPVEWNIPTNQEKNKLALSTFTLLEKMKLVPGTNETGTIDVDYLREWIFNVRSLCAANGRETIADQCIGKVLSGAPIGKDGIWPCEPIREILEELSAPHIGVGVSVGLQNARGPILGASGTEEGELSAKYLEWASQLRFEYPFVAQMLKDIADSYRRHAEWIASKDVLREKLGDDF
jgi:addiction module HigA family antidote